VSPEFALKHLKPGVLLKRLEGRQAILEIADGSVIGDHAALRDAIKTFGRYHIRVAIDDAGARYAGLQRLLTLRPHVIKLDCSLVRGIENDPARQALVVGIEHFARVTRAQVIAEGVEREGRGRRPAAPRHHPRPGVPLRPPVCNGSGREAPGQLGFGRPRFPS